MFHDKLGFSYQGIVRYFLGDPEMFMNPRSFAGLLEVTHFHLFAMGMFFVVFTHLLLFTPLKDSLKTALIWLLALSLLGDIGSSWLIRYVAAPFAWLKLGSFWVLQVVSLFLLLGLLSSLLRRGGKGLDVKSLSGPRTPSVDGNDDGSTFFGQYGVKEPREAANVETVKGEEVSADHTRRWEQSPGAEDEVPAEHRQV